MVFELFKLCANFILVILKEIHLLKNGVDYLVVKLSTGLFDPHAACPHEASCTRLLSLRSMLYNPLFLKLENITNQIKIGTYLKILLQIVG